MNANNKSPKLNGTQLQQRFNTYKARYQKAKDFKNHTGAVILESGGFELLAQKLDAMCPFYSWMDSLFVLKANVTPMAVYDTAKDGLVNDVEIVDFNLILDNNKNAQLDNDSDGLSTQMMESQCKDTPRRRRISCAIQSSESQSNRALDVDEAMDSSQDISLRLGEQHNPVPSTQTFINWSDTLIPQIHPSKVLQILARLPIWIST
jgi:hypothetical protein